MEAKAVQCMQNGMRVLFLLPFANSDNNTKLLLTLKIQQQWQILKEKHNWQNEFNVVSLRRKKGCDIDFDYLKELVQSEEFRDAAVFADELSIFSPDELKTLASISSMNEQRIMWFAITYINKLLVPLKQVKSVFERHNFYIPELVNPIRNSSEIVKYIYPSIRGEFDLISYSWVLFVF